MGEPFRPPPHDFSSHFNYMGIGDLDGRQFHNYLVNIESQGGPLNFNFWEGRKEYMGQGYHEAQSFNMIGIGANMENIWMN